MRQLGDLLIWVVMIAAVLAVLYLTPQFAHYMSEDGRPAPGAARHGLAFLEVDAVSTPDE